MKKLVLLLVLIMSISCSDENIEPEIIPVEPIITEPDIEELEKANPVLSWKKLTYHTFKKDHSQRDNLFAFQKDYFKTEVKENLGIVKYNSFNYNFIKTTIKDQDKRPKDIEVPFITESYLYSRDSLNYTITIAIDTIYNNRIIDQRILDRDPNIQYFLLEENPAEFKYIYSRHETSKQVNYLKSKKNDEFFLTELNRKLDLKIINKGVDKRISTPAGEFNAQEFSLIGRDRETEEREGEGESLHYYYEDFILQEFESTIARISYVRKKELTAIEYLSN